MTEEIRTFIAILISDELKRRIGLVQEEFKKLAPEVKWVSETNFHVTLKFLGNVKSDRIDSIGNALAEAMDGVEPFEIEIGKAGGFPNPGRPRVIWVGITSGVNELVDLAGRVDGSLAGLGFPKEDRAFKAHITIGRAREGGGTGALGPALRESEVGILGSLKVGSIAVMKSDLRRDGPVYSVLREIQLSGAAGGKDANG